MERSIYRRLISSESIPVGLRRRAKPTHILLVLLAMGLGGICFVFLPYTIEDMRAPKNTRFAPGYCEGKFRALRVGMSKQDVQDLLGRPISVEAMSSGGEIWRYTSSIDPEDSFLVNYVVFGPPGKVYEWESSTYYD